MIINPKINDEVILITNRFFWNVGPQNPIYSETKITGKIKRILPHEEYYIQKSCTIEVVWNNGEINSYKENDLELFEAGPRQHHRLTKLFL